MLTKGDLSQIKTVVRQETGKVVKKEISGLQGGLTGVQEDLKSLQGEVKEGFTSLRSEVRVLRKDVTKIRKDMATIVNFFDNEYLELRARVEKIERHLGLATA